jgi:hypothetical protein
MSPNTFFLVAPLEERDSTDRLWATKGPGGRVWVVSTRGATLISKVEADSLYHIVCRQQGGYQHPTKALARRLVAVIAKAA